MSPEELWDKKGVVGLIAVVVFFGVGLFLHKNVRFDPVAWGNIENVRYTKNSVFYDIVLYTEQEGGTLLFRERITNPKGDLAFLRNMEKEMQFRATYTQKDSGIFHVIRVFAPESQ